MGNRRIKCASQGSQNPPLNTLGMRLRRVALGAPPPPPPPAFNGMLKWESVGQTGLLAGQFYGP